jgi:hypothetical protein
MAIATYSDLQSAITSWANRSDLSSNTVDFITLTEARLNDALLLRDMEKEATLSTSTSSNFVLLPSDYVSPLALWIVINTYRQLLEPATPEELPYLPTNVRPQYWAVDGDVIRFDTQADQVYTLYFRYIAKSNLSNSNTTNQLLTKRPDLYLAGGLVELAKFARDQELFNEWEPKFQAALGEVKAAEARNRGVVPMRVDSGLVGRLKSGFNIYKGS